MFLHPKPLNFDISTTHLQSGGEFHHLVGLDVLETVDTGDTITNAEHTTSFIQIGLGGGAQDAFFKDGADFGTSVGGGDVQISSGDCGCWDRSICYLK